MQAIAPLPSRDHLGQEGAGEVEGGKIGHLDHGERLFGAGLEHGQPAARAGIVDEDVGRSCLALDPRARLGDGVRVGKVDRVRAGGAAVAPDGRRHLVELRFIAGEQQNVRAARAIELGRRRADPARCAGYEDELGRHRSSLSHGPAEHAKSLRLSHFRIVPK